jgi:hypothetical protein
VWGRPTLLDPRGVPGSEQTDCGGGPESGGCRAEPRLRARLPLLAPPIVRVRYPFALGRFGGGLNMAGLIDSFIVWGLVRFGLAP